MRSCARRILLAATISIALVIFCVLLTLDICVRISFVLAISRTPVKASRPKRLEIAARYAAIARLPGAARFQLGHQLFELAFQIAVPITSGIDVSHGVSVFRLGERQESCFEVQYFVNF